MNEENKLIIPSLFGILSLGILLSLGIFLLRIIIYIIILHCFYEQRSELEQLDLQ